MKTILVLFQMALEVTKYLTQVKMCLIQVNLFACLSLFFQNH